MKFKGIEVKGTFEVMEYDSGFRVWQNGNEIYWERTDGVDYWWKKEFDDKGIEIYFENSDGDIIDERPKTKTKKVFRLQKFLEDKGLSNDKKTGFILQGNIYICEGKTQEEAKAFGCFLHNDWLVEEAIK